MFMPHNVSIKRILFTLTSIGVTSAVFIYLLNFVSMRDVIQLIKEVNRNALMIFIFFSFGQSFFRTWRYKILLHISGYRPGNIPLFLVVLIRNFFSDLLPARLGSLIYVFLVNTRLGIPLGPATSSFAISFLFDILALVPLILFLAAVASMQDLSSFFNTMLVGGILLGGIVILFILYLNHLFSFMGKLIRKTPGLKTSWKKAVSDLLNTSSEEILKVRRSGFYVPLFVLSICVRLAKYGSLYVFLYALLQPIGYTIKEIPISKALIGICASEFAASLPVSGIAGFGAYEGTWMVVFNLMGFSKTIAQLTAVSHHLFTQVYGYGLGALAFLIILFPVFKADEHDRGRMRSGKPSHFSYVKLSVVVLFIGILTFLLAQFPFAGTKEVPVKSPDKASKEEHVKRLQLAKVLPGRILFDSNRSGTFGIYSIGVDGTRLKKIIDAPDWHEMYPDPSPDGKLIVYSRAKTTSRLAPSEIWMVQRNGENSRKVADDGVFPTFSQDGKTIYFERKRRKAMAVDLNGEAVREIFPAKNDQFKKYRVVKPRVSKNGEIVTFTSNTPKAWNAWYAVIDGAKAFRIHGGCEPVPYENGTKIAWVNNASKGVKERSGIYVYDRENKSYAVLQDAGAPRGHEYFPTLAHDDRFLLYGASRPDEHSHETANYQIFVKDLKTGNVVRITFDAFTNRWPKPLPFY